MLRKDEHQIIASMVAELPDHLRGPVERQFDACNLAQRAVDGRTLNFYKMSRFSRSRNSFRPCCLAVNKRQP